MHPGRTDGLLTDGIRFPFSLALDAAQVARGDVVTLVIRGSNKVLTAQQHPRNAEVVALEVLFEDDHVAVVVKPQGIPTTGAKSLQSYVPFALQPTRAPPEESKGAIPKPRPGHRLDKATGGLVTCAKTFAALAQLREDFNNRNVQKEYVSTASGIPRTRGHRTQHTHAHED